MEFITVEQFKEQSEEVQKVFLDWWKPNAYDLYTTNGFHIYIVGDSNNDLIFPNRPMIEGHQKIKCTPLFTEGQLRKFIEDKTKYKLDAMYYINSYDIRITEGLNNIKVYEDLGTNLLQAYWEVACIVAKEGLNG